MSEQSINLIREILRVKIRDLEKLLLNKTNTIGPEIQIGEINWIEEKIRELQLSVFWFEGMLLNSKNIPTIDSVGKIDIRYRIEHEGIAAEIQFYDVPLPEYSMAAFEMRRILDAGDASRLTPAKERA